MNKNLLAKLFTSLFFATIFSFLIYNNVFASDLDNSSEEVITPKVTTSEVKVVKAPLYSTSNTKTFNNVNDAVSYIMEEAKKFNTSFTFTYKFSGNNLPNFINEIEKAFTKPGNDYVHGILSTYGYSAKIYENNTAIVTINLTYIGTKAQEDFVTKKVKEIANSLLIPNMTDFEKVLAVNNYVVTHANYSFNTKTSPHHVYTLLNEGKGVCQAYALLTYRLLKEMGVEARYVTGKGYGSNGLEDHAWNLVKIDGEWYFLDTTWNDQWTNTKYIYYGYFLVTSNQLREDHIWEENLYPAANNNKYSYIHNIVQGLSDNGYIYYVDKSTLYELDTLTNKKVVKANKVSSNLDIINGTLYYFEKDTKKAYNIPRKSTPIATSSVTVTNNYGKADVITLKNLKTNAIYKIYKDANKKTLLYSFKATKATESKSINQLSATAGAVYISVAIPGYYDSALTKVNYKAEKLPSIAAKYVSVTNNYNAKDKIVLKGLTKGRTYTIYADAGLKKKIATHKATGTTGTITVNQLTANAGAIYVVVSQSGYQNSAATKVTYKAEKLPALSAKNVTITNKVKSDKIAFKGLKKGFTYTVYSDSKLKKKLTSFTATGTTKTVTVKQVGVKAGSVYVVVSKSGYLPSSATKVNFKKQSK